MNYYDIILLGYLVNLIFYLVVFVVLTVVLLYTSSFASPSELLNRTIVNNRYKQITAALTPAQRRHRILVELATLVIPFASIPHLVNRLYLFHTSNYNLLQASLAVQDILIQRYGLNANDFTL